MPVGSILGLLALLFNSPKSVKGWAQLLRLPDGGPVVPKEVTLAGAMLFGITICLAASRTSSDLSGVMT